MKKNAGLIVLFFVTVITGLLMLSILKKIRAQATEKSISEVLPHFNFKSLNNKRFSDSDFGDTSMKLIINYFNPECEHCQYMASSFVKNATKFKGSSLLMVTIADSASISKFKADFQLDLLQNLFIVRDAELQFGKIFGTTVIPSFFIYRDKRLVKKIIGETKIENLLN